jgi:NAD(P)-dependent dehydrogenase (short-subunit alcohol dehydrogenase family)
VLSENAAPAYSASKAAVLHLARNLAVELGPRHILVNGLAPGFFPSKMADHSISAGGGEAKMAALSPNGRLGRPEDVAAAVVYLCSRGAGHVNGDTISLDGGRLLAGSVL